MSKEQRWIRLQVVGSAGLNFILPANPSWKISQLKAHMLKIYNEIASNQFSSNEAVEIKSLKRNGYYVASSLSVDNTFNDWDQVSCIIITQSQKQHEDQKVRKVQSEKSKKTKESEDKKEVNKKQAKKRVEKEKKEQKDKSVESKKKETQQKEGERPKMISDRVKGIMETFRNSKKQQNKSEEEQAQKKQEVKKPKDNNQKKETKKSKAIIIKNQSDSD